MKYLAQHILQAVSDLQYAYLSSVALQSHGKVLTLVNDLQDEQLHHLRVVLFPTEFLVELFEGCCP